MRCERSHKREMLKVWGIRQLGNGASWEEVTASINRLMLKSTAEVKALVAERSQPRAETRNP